MPITVLDTSRGIESVLAAEETDRTEVLREMLTPMLGMYRYFPGEVDLVSMHTLSSGFPLDRDLDTVKDGLQLLRDAGAWERIAGALEHGVKEQSAALPDLEVPDIKFILMLGDPGDEQFMGPVRALSGNGSATGYISLTLWPTDENLDRLEAAAVHELNHNLRYAPGGVVWDPATVVVGEHVISEGLADAFARQLYGDAGYSPIGRAHLHDDAVFDKVVSGLNIGGMHNFGAWVLGDVIAARFGSEPVGLPTGAGYAVGNRLVDAYLTATGKTAAEALHDASATIIDTALADSP